MKTRSRDEGKGEKAEEEGDDNTMQSELTVTITQQISSAETILTFRRERL